MAAHARRVWKKRPWREERRHREFQNSLEGAFCQVRPHSRPMSHKEKLEKLNEKIRRGAIGHCWGRVRGKKKFRERTEDIDIAGVQSPVLGNLKRAMLVKGANVSEEKKAKEKKTLRKASKERKKGDWMRRLTVWAASRTRQGIVFRARWGRTPRLGERKDL